MNTNKYLIIIQANQQDMGKAMHGLCTVKNCMRQGWKLNCTLMEQERSGQMNLSKQITHLIHCTNK